MIDKTEYYKKILNNLESQRKYLEDNKENFIEKVRRFNYKLKVLRDTK